MLELEWYEGVRNGDQYLCDRCNDKVLNIDEFRYNRNNRGVYCDGCRNWIELKKWKCDTCGHTGSIRSERLLIKTCCDKEVTWLE